MKKVLSIILSMVILLSMSIPAFAADNENVAKQNIFQISETVKENNNILRTYTKPESANNSVWAQNEYANTKALLLALGMEQAFIDNLSTDTLEMYSGATSFVGEVSYTKVNSDNVKTYVTEEEAITSAQLINSEQMIMQEGSLVQNRQQDTYQDSYMRVFYLVTYLGDDDNDPGKYYFSTDARWLTMPDKDKI